MHHPKMRVFPSPDFSLKHPQTIPGDGIVKGIQSFPRLGRDTSGAIHVYPVTQVRLKWIADNHPLVARSTYVENIGNCIFVDSIRLRASTRSMSIVQCPLFNVHRSMAIAWSFLVPVTCPASSLVPFWM